MKQSERYKTSDATAYKQESLSDCLGLQMKMVANIRNRNAYLRVKPYLYIDLHGGKGIDEDGARGSPLVFYDAISNSNMPYRAEVYEKDLVSFESLFDACSPLPNFRLHNEDHHEHIKRLPKNSDKRQFGVVYCDPTDINIPVELLQTIVDVYPKMEIIINISATNIKRVRGWARKRDIDETELTWLDNILYSLKPMWIIRKPYKAFQWTILMGTSWPKLPAWRSKNFEKITTPIGRAWFDKVVYSISEAQGMETPKTSKQLSMFDMESE